MVVPVPSFIRLRIEPTGEVIFGVIATLMPPTQLPLDINGELECAQIEYGTAVGATPGTTMVDFCTVDVITTVFVVCSGVSLSATEISGAVEIVAATSFLRGDCNQDATLALTDALTMLNFLFLGGLTPECQDSCDANDDDSIALTDALTVLSFLFSGGPSPSLSIPRLWPRHHQ